MINYNYVLKSHVAFRGTVASTQKVRKVSFFYICTDYSYQFLHLFLVCHRKQITSELLMAFRNVLKTNSYINLNVLCRKRDWNLTGSFITKINFQINVRNNEGEHQ